MTARARCLLIASLTSVACSAPLQAQALHVNHRWKDCSFLLAPSLTQADWRQFVGEAGLVVYLRPLASARPLGAKHVELSALNWATRIDAKQDAWNDTFSHPHETHWLVDDGNPLPIPGLMLRVGATDRLDVGAYFTKNPGANYGFVGAQIQYGLLNDSRRNIAATTRASVVSLYGPEDLSLSVYGLDFLMSKDVAFVSPYAGVSGYLSRGRETTSKVDLHNENVFGVQGMVGVAANISVLRLGAEVNLAKVPGYAIKVGVGL